MSVAIARIAAGGDGVARLDDGMTVFVPRTAPGDQVAVEVVERKRRFARGRLRVVEAPGPGRVEPACVHYVRDGCGGCQLQHLNLATQREAKRAIVGDALRRIAGIEVEDPPIEPAPEAWRYRSKISLARSASGGAVGLHRFDRPGEVFPLDDCRITREPLMELWRTVRAALDLLPPAFTGLVLREDRGGGRHVVVQGGTAPWEPAPFAARAGSGVTVWWQPEAGAPRAVAGAHRGFPVLAFAQVHPGFGDRIRAAAHEALGPVAGSVVWDLYGGLGDGARALAAAGAQVWSVDADRSATDWAAQQPAPSGAAPGFPRYLPGRVEEVLHRLPAPDAVVVNPPRAGLARRVADALDRWGRGGPPGRRLAYVSCDPATLARDVARLPAFRVVGARAWDLFPQTAHVETVLTLEAA